MHPYFFFLEVNLRNEYGLESFIIGDSICHEPNIKFETENQILLMSEVFNDGKFVNIVLSMEFLVRKYGKIRIRCDKVSLKNTEEWLHSSLRLPSSAWFSSVRSCKNIFIQLKRCASCMLNWCILSGIWKSFNISRLCPDLD